MGISSVKIYGAGSIGNHLANASRRLGWEAVICDVDAAALERTRVEIYPDRYGAWDESIGLYLNEDAPRGEADLIVIGTPPDVHVDLAMSALDENPKAVLVEKPLSTPDLLGLQDLRDKADSKGIEVFVGYDHAVSTAVGQLINKIQAVDFGKLLALDVEFREHWHGIFAAHPWLDGPADTYLGYWQRGGGACGEHSHAINLWQHFSDTFGLGRIVRVSAEMDYVRDGDAFFDRVCMIHAETETGFSGRIVQDVVTQPARKESFLQFEDGAARWQCGASPDGDVISIGEFPTNPSAEVVAKTRPDDFIAELRHIDAVLEGTISSSPISLKRGLETMLVIGAAHKSAMEKRNVTIDYERGYSPDSLVSA